jgi:hypothetical protein
VGNATVKKQSKQSRGSSPNERSRMRDLNYFVETVIYSEGARMSKLERVFKAFCMALAVLGVAAGLVASLYAVALDRAFVWLPVVELLAGLTYGFYRLEATK